ncbi:MAG: nucleoside-diphosphate sugar epimerase/dehydratase [SAR324 cluster bacterium]|nr:nucleoside-diphosphate sugar epimerase/dehydratase [SAR324 cluster bacterium]
MARLAAWARIYLAPSLHDLAWVPLSIFLAYWLRFNLGPIPTSDRAGMIMMIVLAIVIHAPLFYQFGLFRIVWSFVSLPDVLRIVRSVGLGVLAVSLAILIVQRAEGVPRSVFLLYPLILLFGLTIPRVLMRAAIGRKTRLTTQDQQRVLVVGTGNQAERALRNILQSSRYMPMGLVADSPDMGGREIHRVRVLGGIADIPELVRKLDVELVVLALEEEGRKSAGEIIQFCASAKVPCRVVSSSEHGGDGLNGGNWALRPVTLEDLLFRTPVALDASATKEFIRGRRILVTGGGGSIGSELCMQLAANGVGRLLIVDSSEFNLFQIEQNLAQRYPNAPATPLLGDIKDPAAMERLFEAFQPEIVYHAAAYKHVPLLESNPIPAVVNNVLGTRNVAQAADKYGCTHFVLISTDKAVYSTSLMGATKRVAEIFVQCLNDRSQTRFITTRFGNVLGSAGSVIPIFEQQIANGGPVTITHPDATRYFMTIPEAVSLILAAGSIGSGGELFVLDMGEPVNIREIAEKLIRLKGLEPERDIPLVQIGLRPGEKMQEELFHHWEQSVGTSHPHLMIAAGQDSNYGWELLGEGIASLESAAKAGDFEAILKQLKTMLPEFREAMAKNVERAKEVDSA